MAAAALLDSIINETIHRSSFGGSALFEQSLLRNLPPPPTQTTPTLSQQQQHYYQSASSSSSINNQLASADQLDRLAAVNYAAAAGSAVVEIGSTERLVWILLFSLMVLIAAGGNIIVVYIVSTNKEMKSVTNYFLVNLSLADTMVSTLNVIFNFISMLNSHWSFGTVYCKISNFIAILSISASVFTLTAISCDRYNAIIHPLRPRMSHKHAIGWILLIWTLSSALAMPNAIYSTVVEDRLANDNIGLTCTMVWPDGRYPFSSYDHIYNIIILVVTYLVPILTMAILYYQVGKELWGYEAIGENIDKQQRAIIAKKKIVKMMIVVVIIFALCWLPYHAFFVVNYYLPNIFQDMPLQYQRCYLFMYWLAMSNSMYNPIIIYFMNSNFRHEFRKILCLMCCCRHYKSPTRPVSVAAHNNHTTIRTTNHTQIRRQITQDSQTKNLNSKSPDPVDKNINNNSNFVMNNNHTNNNSITNNINTNQTEVGPTTGKKPTVAATNHHASPLAQADDLDQNVVIDSGEKTVCDSPITTNYINNNNNNNNNSNKPNNNNSNRNHGKSSEIGTNLNNLHPHHNHHQHHHHHHHHHHHSGHKLKKHQRQSPCRDSIAVKNEPEEEPFIVNENEEALNLNETKSNEKLIDFVEGTNTTISKSNGASNHLKLHSTDSIHNDKVWI